MNVSLLSITTMIVVAVDRAHLLLVEDDPLVRSSIRRSLRDLALTVVDFSDAATAAAYLRAPGAPVDIVWADFVVEDGPRGGYILRVAAERSARPHLLLVSGSDAPPDELPKGTRVFRKPDLRAALDWERRLVPTIGP
jgi:CheY-like chemotaxis protein